jgi:hypothetical protein
MSRRGLLLAGAGLAYATRAIGAPLQLPPLVTPASAEHHAGKIVFVELVTPDVAAAKQFYAALFGWTYRDLQADGLVYAQAYLGQRPVAGMVQRPIPAGEHRQPAWLSFLSVPNVDAARATASRLGGKVLFEPRDFPDRGREAVLADPRGAVFAVLTSSSGDPPDVLAMPGEWIWSSLITPDPDADVAFYKALFNYEVFPLPEQNGAQHLMLASDGYARASMNPMPTSAPDGHPAWIDFVRVDDAVGVGSKALSLGGRVVVPPRVDRHGGKIAVVADPQGAVFGLMEWPSTETKEVPR